MRHLRILAFGFLAAVVVADRPAGGQDAELKEPYAFFSSAAQQPAAADPDAKTKLSSLYLRPNQEQSAYVFVRNPTNTDATVNVILSAGPENQAGAEVGRANGVVVRAKTTVRVPLAAAGKAPPPVPTPPAADKDKDKKEPAPAPPPAGVKLGKTQLALRVEYADEANPKQRDAKTRQTYELDVWKPSEFIRDEASYDPAAKQLIIRLSFKAAKQNPYLTGEPAKVRLDLRPDLNTALVAESLSQGTYEAELPLGDDPTQPQAVQLVAQGVQFKPGQQRRIVVAVSVDGYDRAFLYETNLQAENPGTFPGSFVNIKPSADKLIPGQPCQLRLEYTVPDLNEDAAAAELRIDRRGQGTFADVVKRFTGLRKKEIYVRTGGSDDAVIFTTVLSDWVYDFPTANVFGERTFQLLARGSDGRTVPSTTEAEDAARSNVRNVRSIILDRTPPRVEEFRRPRAADALTGAKVTVRARVSEDLTGFKQVLFYVGDPPAADAKLVPGKLVRGKPVGAAGPRDQIYEATLTLPDQRGPAQVGVRVVNEVGIPNVDDEDRSFAVIDVREPTPQQKEKERTTGTITGRVLQGTRPQPGLPVELRDAEGTKLIKATKSDENGEFKFEEVPPGAYAVLSYKKVDASKGMDKVAVEAGKTATASINVLR